MGQHFLVDRRVAVRIVELLEPHPPRVLEIGPGRGALTELLVPRFERVLAIELDPELAPALAGRFAGSRLEVRVADALRDPLDGLLVGEAPWQVVSNLPYSVGTAILRRLLPRPDLFSRLVVMLQREVAERIIAVPGERGHGLIALERAAYGSARIAFHVAPSAFRPRPKVVSSVLVVDLARRGFERDELETALKLAAHALTRPRKKLKNALEPLVSLSTLRAAGVDPDARPGTLALPQWLELARCTGSPAA
jgi:16S rRNA (adenine1518-N6/adenine1519-N6)-dimethyltransferase